MATSCGTSLPTDRDPRHQSEFADRSVSSSEYDANARNHMLICPGVGTGYPPHQFPIQTPDQPPRRPLGYHLTHLCQGYRHILKTLRILAERKAQVATQGRLGDEAQLGRQHVTQDACKQAKNSHTLISNSTVFRPPSPLLFSRTD